MTKDPDIKDYTITIILAMRTFRHRWAGRPRIRRNSMTGRTSPKKGLLNGQIDWDILYDCTREAMEMRNKEGGSNG